MEKTPQERGFSPLTVEIYTEDLYRLKKIGHEEQRSMGYLVRHAVRFWLAQKYALKKEGGTKEMFPETTE
jgi:hypothetical protein